MTGVALDPRLEGVNPGTNYYFYEVWMRTTLNTQQYLAKRAPATLTFTPVNIGFPPNCVRAYNTHVDVCLLSFVCALSAT